MLFNLYIIINVSYCWLRSQIKLLSDDWRDVIGGIVYVIKIYASNDITNHPLWSAVGDILSW